MMALKVSAQELSINSFTQAVGDLSASTNPRKDANSDACALVKMYVLDDIISVEGESAGKVVTDGNEKLIYLCNGVKSFRIKFKYHYPLNVSFPDYGMSGAQSNSVYVLELIDSNISNSTKTKTTSQESKATNPKAERPSVAQHEYEEGENYFYGRGVKQDYVEAVSWFRKAAEQGEKIGQYNLARCYYYGNGVYQYYEVAIVWLRKAADQGYSEAQWWLGECYEVGSGVSQDKLKAEYWYRKAAKQENENAKPALKRLNLDGTMDSSYKKSTTSRSIPLTTCKGQLRRHQQ